jgi:hypothetical protein
MAEACRERGIKFRVALLPFLRTQGSRFQQQEIHKMIRLHFEANQIEVVDLSEVVKHRPATELVVNSVDAHPNELAHQLFADKLWEFWQTGQP